MFRQARPIWIKDKRNEMNVYAVFSLNTKLDAAVQKAELHITGYTFYRVSVNGEFLGFGPARTALGYAREDVLAIDVNTLGRLGAGVDGGQDDAEAVNCQIVIEACGYNCRGLSTVFQPSFLMAELVCDGQVIAYTGRDFEGFLPTCKVQKTERYSRQRHFTEIWDYRGFAGLTAKEYRAEVEEVPEKRQIIDRLAPYPLYEEVDLTAARSRGTFTYDETLPCQPLKYSRGFLPDGWGYWEYDEIELHPHTWIQKLRQTITEKQIALPVTLEEGQFAILDFGRIETGFLKTQLEAVENSDVVVSFSEYYEGEEFQLPFMNAHNVVEYFLEKGDAREHMTFEPYTCRFAIVAVKSGAVKLNSFGVKTFMFDISGVEEPKYEDEVLNSICRAAVRTFAHNSVDIYMDCPSRERAGWLCDSYFTAKTEYAMTGKTGVEDAFLENFRLYKDSEYLPDKMIPMVFPGDSETDTEDGMGRYIPQWSMWYIIEAAEYILKRGHKDLTEAFRPSIYRLLGFYRQYENADGLLERLPSWNFVEWSKANDWTWDVNYPTNFLYAKVLESIADIYGDEECRRRSKEVQEKAVEQSFNGTYFCDHAERDDEGKLVLLDDSSEAGQYYAVLFGGIDINSQKFRALKTLITDVFAPDRGDKMPEIMEVNAFIGAYLRLEALMKMGEYKILLRDVKGFFGNMEQYTGTLWEYRQFRGSCDHGFASYAMVAIQEAMSHLG